MAAAIIWWLILAQVAGVDVSLGHLNRGHWADHGRKGNCASCLSNPIGHNDAKTKVQPLLTEFRQTWMQLGHTGVSPQLGVVDADKEGDAGIAP